MPLKTEGGLLLAHRPPTTEYHENAGFGVVWCLKNGYSYHTIRFVRKALLVIEKGCGLEDPLHRVTLQSTEVQLHFLGNSHANNLCEIARENAQVFLT